MKAAKNGRFTVRPVTLKQNGVAYETFELYGWLQGKPVRRRFKDRGEALGEKFLLEVEAANTGEIRARPTRLTAAQLAEAEAAFARLGSRPLSLAVEWFLDTYRPPVTEMPLADAEAAFLADRRQHVRAVTLRDYSATLAAFRGAVKARYVHEVNTASVLEYLTGRNVGKKRWNNLRGDLHAFFAWCKLAPRQWTQENPVATVATFKIRHGVPEIESAERLAKLFAFLETYTGEYGKRQAPGFLVPYFALATFAGLRPSVVEGEIAKMGALPAVELAKIVDLDLNVIRVGPRLAKTHDQRNVTIQPNLAQGLLNYPLQDYPIAPPNLKQHVTRVRESWGLKEKDDVLRHTFISMHVAKFKSIGLVALEAGNSERMVKKHYLQRVSEKEADAFWAIVPAG